MPSEDRRVFFFPHGLDPTLKPLPGLPGRVPFDVVGQLVSGRTVEFGPARIFADGFGPNVVGPNQDPCVFSTIPLHSFCRIGNKRGHDNYVRGTELLLSHAVKSGDLVIYGKFEVAADGQISCVWVDTVLLVNRAVSWRTAMRTPGRNCANPTCARHKFTHGNPSAFAAVLPAPDGRAYRFNLRDGEPTGMHCCTSLADYKVITGRWSALPSSLTALETSFVPLSESRDGVERPCSVTATDLGNVWGDIAAFLAGQVRWPGSGPGPRGGWIAQFPSFELGRALLDAVVAASGRSQGRPGTVVVSPTPASAPMRWDPHQGCAVSERTSVKLGLDQHG